MAFVTSCSKRTKRQPKDADSESYIAHMASAAMTDACWQIIHETHHTLLRRPIQGVPKYVTHIDHQGLHMDAAALTNLPPAVSPRGPGWGKKTSGGPGKQDSCNMDSDTFITVPCIH